MSQFKGRLVNVGLAPQSNYTTPVTTPVYTVPWMDLSLKDTIETLQNESANGTIAHFNDSIVSGVHGEGEIQTKLWHKGLYYFLLWIFGQAPTKTTNGDGSYKYTFTMANNNQHLAQTVVVNDPNNPCYFPTAVLSEATIAWTPSDFATLTASLISKKSVAGSAFTPAYVDDAEFKPSHLELKIADSVSGLSGASAATLFTSVSLAVSKNVEGTQTSDSGVDYGAFMNGDLEATLSFEKLYNDTTYRALALDGTKKAISFGFVDPENKAGTNTNTSLKFILPKVKLSSYETSFGLGDTATESFEATALFDNTAAALITAELVTKYSIS